jgi:uncharacterized protein YdcH (DUF465 family)
VEQTQLRPEGFGDPASHLQDPGRGIRKINGYYNGFHGTSINHAPTPIAINHPAYTELFGGSSVFSSGHAPSGYPTIRHHLKPNPPNPAMLSEHHDISHEFPEYHRLLEALRAKDSKFDALVAKHDYIDDEIRQLEERQSPISDSEIEKMKFERTALKDQIYQTLRAAQASA